MNQTTRQGIIVIIIILILSGIGAAAGSYAQKHPTTSTLPDTSSLITAQPISYEGQTGKSALDILKETHQVETTDSSIGTFVTAIDGVGSTANSFWLFYIDGQPATDAADKIMTEPGQTVEWRYESF